MIPIFATAVLTRSLEEYENLFKVNRQLVETRFAQLSRRAPFLATMKANQIILGYVESEKPRASYLPPPAWKYKDGYVQLSVSSDLNILYHPSNTRREQTRLPTGFVHFEGSDWEDRSLEKHDQRRRWAKSEPISTSVLFYEQWQYSRGQIEFLNKLYQEGIRGIQWVVPWNAWQVKWPSGKSRRKPEGSLYLFLANKSYNKNRFEKVLRQTFPRHDFLDVTNHLKIGFADEGAFQQNKQNPDRYTAILPDRENLANYFLSTKVEPEPE